MNTKRIKPGPGQESVWDYPRPPRLEDCAKRIRVIAEGEVIADSTGTKRVLETSHPPVYYIPPDDIEMEYLMSTDGGSFCEWKGEARYYSIAVSGKTIEKAAWYYPKPSSRFARDRRLRCFLPQQSGCLLCRRGKGCGPRRRFLWWLDNV